ncbi:MAG: acetyl-CoA C-acyltransferase [Methylacidiphilales bacterium]|nr:acetyl-CoA C-acyltransferase [Candidatus Methylacidiphilales bacterium]
MKSVWILDAKRTAIGKLNGQFAHYQASDLGAHLVKTFLMSLSTQNVNPNLVTRVIFGQVLTAGAGQNPARQSALGGGCSDAVVASTVNMVCGSGLYAVLLGYQEIALGNASLVISGGQEVMSKAPFLLPDMRSGKKLGHTTTQDSIVHDGLWCAFKKYHMGITAENIATKYSISKETQDQFAFQSHQKATQATRQGLFAHELVLLDGEDSDQQIRSESDIGDFSKLKAVFSKDGTVTAGNASGINDGAAAVLLCDESALPENAKPLARIVAFGLCGIDPAFMGLGPVQAIQTCLTNAGWNISDVDLFELNEAFACQSLAVINELKINFEKVNVQGGAIALGHPIGASGCRVLTTLVHAMHKNNCSRGVASLCIGGGQGIAIAVERA